MGLISLLLLEIGKNEYGDDFFPLEVMSPSGEVSGVITQLGATM